MQRSEIRELIHRNTIPLTSATIIIVVAYTLTSRLDIAPLSQLHTD